MNLLKGKNYQSDDCIFDVHSFATELDEDTLRTKVNGGCCDASAPSAPPSPPSGVNTPVAPSITGTTPTTNPGTSPTTDTPNPSDPSNPGSGYTGGGYEPPPEVMSNPQAYGYWKALQALAEQQGDPDRYKDYNVLGHSSKSNERINGAVSYPRWAYVVAEGIGAIGGFSRIRTSYQVNEEKNELTVFTKARYGGTNLISLSDYNYFGNVTLYIDNEPVEKKIYEKPTESCISDGTYGYTVGEVKFSIPSSFSEMHIVSDVDCEVNNWLLDYSPVDIKLK